MRLALREARKGSGRTFPNPPVGAVLYRGGEVLARGRTQRAGGAHAEIVALESARRRHGAAALRGASLAVTLEPCAHRGRTGPCVEAILEAKLRRVVIGHRDPHPEVDGRGLRKLRRAGLDVAVGVLEAACRDQHRGFLSVVERGRPFVRLKLGATLDGRIATASGESKWITGAPARAFVHRLRARCDALLVGSETVRVDDPELTARRGGRIIHRPLRVVVDTALRVPVTRKIFRDGHADRTWLLCGRAASGAARKRVLATGARLVESPTRRGHVELRGALARLAKAGPTDLLCEGGGGLAAALLRADCVDELLWIAAPTLLGSDALGALAKLGVARLAGAPRFEIRELRRLGDDVLMRATPARKNAERKSAVRRSAER